jgi:anaerobic selenocysteine-containing dehydrogenase
LTEPSPQQTLPYLQLSLLCRRRRLGQNSWIHGAERHGEAAAAAWFAPADLARLGVRNGAEVILSTACTSLRVPVAAVPEVMCGTVVIPHGIATMNVNALIPSGPAHLEPLSGQHWMTGIAVRATPA